MKTYIQRIINDTIKKLNYPTVDFSVEQPKDEKFGDYSANIAMMLARPLKSNPRKIAQEISDNLIYDKDNFEKIEIAGAGFLNFYFSKKYFQKALNNIISEGKNFGRLNLNAGRKVNVEWVSANPTKPLH